MKKNRLIRVGIISLGCPKNLVDSEMMLGSLPKNKFKFVNIIEKADIAIVNTCAFIADAKKESIDQILELAELKNSGKINGIIVTGCLPQKYSEPLKNEIPEIDACLGTSEFHQISKTIHKILKGNRIFKISNPENLYDDAMPRLNLSLPHSRYLKISEGCNHRCSFCIIPQLRGRYRSRPTTSIYNEAAKMVKTGVKEINLIAQDLTYYGIDTHKKQLLPSLIKKLDKLKGSHWLRLFYTYPSFVSSEIMTEIANGKHVCNYLDIPLQHISTNILKNMKRPSKKETIYRLIDRIKTKIPNVCLRTTFITGFPGETEKNHKELMKFIKDVEFDKVGIFAYSDEEDAASFRLKRKLPDKLKTFRRNELMKIQQKISKKKNEALVGKTLEVLIDHPSTPEKIAIGRTYREGPDIDGNVYVKSMKKLKSGDFIQAKITSGLEYDLKAEQV